MSQDEKIKELGLRIITAIKKGDVKDREAVQRMKIELCGELGLTDVPANSSILKEVAPQDRKLIEPFLIKKPMRTMSGVAVVAVMTSPHPCPHGKCAYCPGGVDSGSPQSYTGKEPAARRAERNNFDPFLQVKDRIDQLTAIGHKTDKIDLIIMGGTFTSREREYQEWFVKRCLDAMNGEDSEDIKNAKQRNETSEHRCIGLTVETRPDVFGDEQIEMAMMLGATRVELGVQILDDDVLALSKRGHGVKEIIDSTRSCKDHGLKVCYHIMPGLPGSTPEKDLECFKRVFEDPDFRPDMLKFYPTLVISGTELFDLWKKGEYTPYDESTAVDLLSKMKSIVPEYTRIQRVERDIPAPQITAGIKTSNIRQVVQENMAAHGMSCRCIRCREVGHTNQVLDDPDLVNQKAMEYEASEGFERFVSLEYNDSLIGYVRLRTDDTDTATIRELKVFGKIASIGSEGEDWQHRGFGKELMLEAERLAVLDGKKRMRINSGIGVRGYYRALGYVLEEPYMVKDLS
ncbi:coproporphyrinogen III oxidase [Candidatus Methanoplasma termitum]|uniref:tRNA carboxymethyluridine synthase n=1 Tax=Candidatus Methanoplasma termitum TaxID=1577791 RepID=A0A0A7LE46_9ARCH|nr:tRNA uridine(34) 5-carboxymethylaminomethyl modification radical SAM/GNAT enzyme Elp3 [Candidatus Methanoplasma termitum]AIZ57263.1 coproporphyrinogen III oxidase [Candidatus Methanoplasma termitum]MCL2334352.1 tRNA uridine(34) 5-carboxymethylaminomethyl modification radical SAM/GNAT enzyme Elp3 [Candidatus Methanoplasma sp.]